MKDHHRTRTTLVHGSIFTACCCCVLYLLDYHQASRAVAYLSQGINACVLVWLLVELVSERNRRERRLRRFRAIMHGEGSQLEKMAKLQELQAELDARQAELDARRQ